MHFILTIWHIGVILCVIIYRITNLKNGKIYIGQTTTLLEERWKQHVCAALYGKNRDYGLLRAIKKYGAKSFKIEAIDTALTIEELNIKEWFFASMLMSYAPIGYNLRECGDSFLCHPSTIAKRSKTYKFFNPQNQVVEITNLAQFCHENNLDKCHMYEVAKGRRSGHKGWRHLLSSSRVYELKNDISGISIQFIEEYGFLVKAAKATGIGKGAVRLLFLGKTKKTVSGWYLNKIIYLNE